MHTQPALVFGIKLSWASAMVFLRKLKKAYWLAAIVKSPKIRSYCYYRYQGKAVKGDLSFQIGFTSSLQKISDGSWQVCHFLFMAVNCQICTSRYQDIDKLLFVLNIVLEFRLRRVRLAIRLGFNELFQPEIETEMGEQSCSFVRSVWRWQYPDQAIFYIIHLLKRRH